MAISSSLTRTPVRRIARRTRGQTHGPLTRLMSPSDFGQILKPFVFLDLFDIGTPLGGVDLHPHSGIATLTYVAEGAVSYVDTNGATGVVPAGGVEWMQAGGGVWHGGGAGESGRTRGFQLWIALPPKLELGPSLSRYLGPETIPRDGPAAVLLGSYGGATSPIEVPSPINYLAVQLKSGERWRYQPPAGHTVLMVAIGSGSVTVPDELRQGDLAAFEPSNDRPGVRGPIGCGVCSRLSRSARAGPRPWLLLRTHQRRCAPRSRGSDRGDQSASGSGGPTLGHPEIDRFWITSKEFQHGQAQARSRDRKHPAEPVRGPSGPVDY